MSRDRPGRTYITWGVFFVFLFVYRSAYSVLGEVIVMRFTPISDTLLYQQGIFEQTALWKNFGVEALGYSDTILATGLTAFIGGSLNAIFFGEPILVNIGFQSITFVGLVYLISSIKVPDRYYVAALVLLPSFTLWTSIASKEAIVASALAIASGYIIKFYYREGKIKLIHIVSAAVLYIFKFHYLAALGFFFAAAVIGRYVRQRAFSALVVGLLSLVGLYVMRDKIAKMAEFVQWSILSGPMGRSTRVESFFVEQYDVFAKAPIGLFQAYFGPTIEELTKSPLHVLSFVESTILTGVLVYLLAKRLRSLPVYNLIVGSFVLFWIVFANYPQGIVNPGSAIRYRSGWIILVIVVITTFMSREMYQALVSRSRKDKLVSDLE